MSKFAAVDAVLAEAASVAKSEHDAIAAIQPFKKDKDGKDTKERHSTSDGQRGKVASSVADRFVSKLRDALASDLNKF